MSCAGARPALLAFGAVAAALLALAGCSSATSSTSAATSPASATTAPATPAVTAPATPAASMTPLPAAAGQLTGTQLKSVLLPESDFPSGFATPTTGPVSSGGSLSAGKATYDLATMSCATFIQHLGTTGFGETAMVLGSVSSSGQAYDQLVYQFASPAQATAFVSGVRSLAARCGSFKATANGENGTFSLQAAAGPSVGGHPSVDLRQTGRLGTSALVVNTVLCASGVDVFGAAGVGVGGSAAPTVPTAESIIYQLMKRQAAVAVLG